MQMYENLPKVDDLIADNQNLDGYLVEHQKAVARNIKQTVKKKNTVKTALSVALGCTFFFATLSWLIPVLCHSALNVLVPVGIIGTLFGGGTIFFVVGIGLDPDETNCLEGILTLFYTRKLSKQKFSPEVFSLDVQGDKELGRVKVVVNNNLHNKALFSKSFGLQEETEAMETIAEAQNLVQDANYKIQQITEAHQIEAEGFVNRALVQAKV